MNKVTVGILGAGRIGRLHAANLESLSGVELKTIADPYLDASATGPAGVELSLDPDTVLRDDEIDAVLICSSTSTHAQLIETAAGAGKHVFCEKPIDLDPQRALAAVSAAEAAGVKLQIGFNRRFDPNFLRIKRAVEDGDVGDVHLVVIVSRDPAPPPIEYIDTSGGLFLDMMIHDFDMVRYLSASEIVEVHAFGSVLVDPAIGERGDVDTAVVSLKLESGALAVIENCRRAAYGYDQRVEVFGSRGSIEAFNETPSRTRLQTAELVRSENPQYFFLERYQAAFRAEIEAFFSSVRGDRGVPVTGRDGLAPLHAAVAAQQSLLENRPVSLAQRGAASKETR